jgi:hypothetical protein
LSLCQFCSSDEARVIECATVPTSEAERLLLDLAAFVGVRLQIHRVRLVECPSCVPGRVTRYREVVMPLEENYAKGFIRR